MSDVPTYQDAEKVQVLGGSRVVSALILKLGVSVQGVQVLLAELKEKTENLLNDPDRRGDNIQDSL